MGHRFGFVTSKLAAVLTAKISGKCNHKDFWVFTPLASLILFNMAEESVGRYEFTY